MVSLEVHSSAVEGRGDFASMIAAIVANGMLTDYEAQWFLTWDARGRPWDVLRFDPQMEGILIRIVPNFRTFGPLTNPDPDADELVAILGQSREAYISSHVVNPTSKIAEQSISQDSPLEQFDVRLMDREVRPDTPQTPVSAVQAVSGKRIAFLLAGLLPIATGIAVYHERIGQQLCTLITPAPEPQTKMEFEAAISKARRREDIEEVLRLLNVLVSKYGDEPDTFINAFHAQQSVFMEPRIDPLGDPEFAPRISEALSVAKKALEHAHFRSNSPGLQQQNWQNVLANVHATLYHLTTKIGNYSDVGMVLKAWEEDCGVTDGVGWANVEYWSIQLETTQEEELRQEHAERGLQYALLTLRMRVNSDILQKMVPMIANPIERETCLDFSFWLSACEADPQKKAPIWSEVQEIAMKAPDPEAFISMLCTYARERQARDLTESQ